MGEVTYYNKLCPFLLEGGLPPVAVITHAVTFLLQGKHVATVEGKKLAQLRACDLHLEKRAVSLDVRVELFQVFDKKRFVLAAVEVEDSVWENI